MLINLFDLTEGDDPEDAFDICVVCGSSDVRARGFFLSAQSSGKTNAFVGRVAWCGAEDCVADRDATTLVIPVRKDADGSLEIASTHA